MNRDEILDEYEALWRQQAMNPVGRPCALTVDVKLGHEMIWQHPIRWACPEPACRGHWHHRATSLGGAVIHLFDCHGYRFDWFANKFRDALAQGETS